MTLKEHLWELDRALIDQDVPISKATKLIQEAHASGKRLWMLGNGGSLAIAQHFAQDLLKCHGLRAQCLNDPSVLTAYANDEGFTPSFFMPLRVLSSPGDIIIVFSCSGKSRNYNQIFSNNSKERPKTIAILGTDGGHFKERADVAIHVNHKDYKVCETGFNIVADIINHSLGEK